jgi:hypothetical protein
LNFAKTCPIGLRSGEYFGRKTRLALQDADLGLRRCEPGKVALQIRLPLTDIRNGQLLPFPGAESVVRQPSCFAPGFDGASLSKDSKDALWDKFFTGAPRRQSGCVLRQAFRGRHGV